MSDNDSAGLNVASPAQNESAQPAPTPPEPPKTIAVLGEIPFAGAVVARELFDAGFNVRVLCADDSAERAVSTATGARGNTLLNVKGSIESDAAIREALQGAFALVFLSPIGLTGRTYRPRTHLEDCKRVIGAAEAGAVRKIVYQSALGAYEKALSKTMREAAAAEALFQHCRCEDYCIRTAPLMGLGDNLMSEFLASAQKGAPLMTIEGYGSTQLQPLHIKDMAACVARIFRDQPSELAPNTYQLAGPELTSILELHDQAMERVGRFKFKIHFPLSLMRLAGMVRPGSGFEERLNLLYDLFFTDKNDVPKLAGAEHKLRTLKQTQDEILGIGAA